MILAALVVLCALQIITLGIAVKNEMRAGKMEREAKKALRQIRTFDHLLNQ